MQIWKLLTRAGYWQIFYDSIPVPIYKLLIQFDFNLNSILINLDTVYIRCSMSSFFKEKSVSFSCKRTVGPVWVWHRVGGHACLGCRENRAGRESSALSRVLSVGWFSHFDVPLTGLTATPHPSALPPGRTWRSHKLMEGTFYCQIMLHGLFHPH